MEGSINMATDIHEQNFNSDSNPGPLNTTSRPVLDQDDVEFNVNNESILPDELMNLFNNCSVSPSIDRLLRITETIASDVQKLKRSNRTINNKIREQKQSNAKIEAIVLRQGESITRIEEALQRQKRSNKCIIKLLKQSLQPNTLNNKTNERFVRSKRNASEFRLPVASRSNQEVLINRNRNSPTTHGPSESNITMIEENRNQIPLTTTNELNFDDQVSHNCDAIDQIRSEKNQGKIQIGQWCFEINVGTTDDTPALIAAADHVSSTIPVLQENQSQRTEENRRISTSNSLGSQPSPHLITPIRNLLSTCQNPDLFLISSTKKFYLLGGSTRICFLHPLGSEINEKTDNRYTKLKDCFGSAPVLLVFGVHLPHQLRIEVAMIFTSKKGSYYSVYRFSDKRNEYKDFESREIKTGDHQPQRIELNDLKVYKRRNNNMRNEEIFILKKYPSGEIENTKIDVPKNLHDEYHFKTVQLAILFFQNATPLLNGTVFKSNLLHGVSKIKPSHYELNISTIYPCKKISFDSNNRYQMEFLTKLPEPFHCTLLSGYKWFEISIITNGHLNPVYAIDTGNGETKNPNYINIKQKSFRMRFQLVKQTLSELMNNQNLRKAFANSDNEIQTSSSITYDISAENIHSAISTTGFNHFDIQIRLLHSEGFPNELSKKYYDCKTWISKKFTEDVMSYSINQPLSIPHEQEIVRNMGLKRKNEFICDYSLGLPTCKASKISENTS